MSKNELFRKLWSEADKITGTNILIGKFGIKSVVNPGKITEKFNFYLFAVPILEDPRFEMELLVPVDLATYQYYQL